MVILLRGGTVLNLALHHLQTSVRPVTLNESASATRVMACARVSGQSRPCARHHSMTCIGLSFQLSSILRGVSGHQMAADTVKCKRQKTAEQGMNANGTHVFSTGKQVCTSLGRPLGVGARLCQQKMRCTRGQRGSHSNLRSSGCHLRCAKLCVVAFPPPLPNR